LEKKSSFFIFLFIIAVMTLIIAVLASFILLVGISGTKAEAEEPAREGGVANNTLLISPPDEEDLSIMPLLETSKPINLKSENAAKPSYAIIEMSVKFFNKLDGIKDVQSKMNLNKANLQEIVTMYFMAMDVETFSKVETKIKAKEELKEQLNFFLLSTIAVEKDRRKVKEVVYDVVFSSWNYQ